MARKSKAVAADEVAQRKAPPPVEAPARKKVKIPRKFDAASKTATWDFSAIGKGEVSTTLERVVSAGISRDALAFHGLSQKGSDSMAIGKDPTTWPDSVRGMSVLEAKYTLLRAEIDRLEAGVWTQPRASSGPALTFFLRAIIELLTASLGREVTAADAEAWIATRAKATGADEKEVRRALRKHPKVATIISRLEIDRAQRKAKEAEATAAAAPDIF